MNKLTRVQRIGLAALLIVLVFSVLTLVFWNFVRDAIVTPIYYVLWLGNLTLNSFPQGAYLALLLLICVVVSLNTLDRIRSKNDGGRFERSKAQADSRYLHWKVLSSNLSSSYFSRNRFSAEARQLILAILANEYGIDSKEAEARVRNGVLAVPETIKGLIEKKESYTDRAPALSLIESVRERLPFLKPAATPAAPVDSTVTEVVAFIEYYVERPDGNQPQP